MDLGQPESKQDERWPSAGLGPATRQSHSDEPASHTCISTITYRPARSYGYLWLVGLGLLVLAPPVLVLIVNVMRATTAGKGPVVVSVLVLALCAIVSAVFFLAASWFPTMRYELGPDKLIMICGPIRYNVPLKEIRRVVKRDLALSILSSMRLPGFALGDVPYSDVGTVTMCATRALKEILLLETDKNKYGLTPADEESFLRELENRLSSLQR